MIRTLCVEAEQYPLAAAFTISRGSKTQAAVLTCTIREGGNAGREDGNAGRGECVPYARYGETVEGVREEIEALRARIEGGISRQELLAAMKPGAARNAIDCALWDLEAKAAGTPVARSVCAGAPRPLETAYTITLGEPEAMAAQASANAGRPLLKVKVGTGDDVGRIEAVARAAPRSRIILDANEGWSEDNLARHLAVAARCGVALIEQPLPAGRDAALGTASHAVPICADESVHTASRLEALAGLYDAVNIKLDKAGGLTEAIAMRGKARDLGLSVMVGCMVGTSLAMAPAVLLAQDADYVDLDGPLLLARDRVPGLVYDGSLVSPPEAGLWG